MLPLSTAGLGETFALLERSLGEVPWPCIRAALAQDEPANVAGELRGILEERYDLIERYWPLLAVIERCAAEMPELDALWFGEGRGGIFADLAEYLQRRTASGRLRPMPDPPTAARLIAELVAWFAWHRHEGRDAALYDDKTARRTVEFICAALVPENARESASGNEHRAERSTSHGDSH